MKLQYIFVHGLSGWGSYDERYQKRPYWGMKNGDLMEHLRDLGHDCYAASVAPKGSAWDRACELYAQLAGTITDYGAAHTAKAKHARYGRDFSGEPLIGVWDEEHPVVLIGHSFGGATVRLFSQILVNGEKEEQDNTDPADLSPFFKGNSEKLIRGIITLAAPHNGTTSYDMYDDPDFDPYAVKVPPFYRMLGKVISLINRTEPDGRESFDYAPYDMHIDNADALNRKIETIPYVYYWSYPASSTEVRNGVSCPKKEITEPLFIMTSTRMGSYQGKTKGGIVIDPTWQENDGLVNTVSAKAPSHSPQKDFEAGNIRPGIWNIMPKYPYDHMSFQGGMMKHHDIFPFYEQIMKMAASAITDEKHSEN